MEQSNTPGDHFCYYGKKNPSEGKSNKVDMGIIQKPTLYLTFMILYNIDFYNEIHMKISFLSLNDNDYTIVWLCGIPIY